MVSEQDENQDALEWWYKEIVGLVSITEARNQQVWKNVKIWRRPTFTIGFCVGWREGQKERERAGPLFSSIHKHTKKLYK